MDKQIFRNVVNDYARKLNISPNLLMNAIFKANDKYPAPGSYIALLADNDYIENAPIDYISDEELADGPKNTKFQHQFNKESAEDSCRNEAVRYILKVNRIEFDENGTPHVVCDASDGMYVFKDSEVTVVDVYLTPSEILENTFAEDYDPESDQLAVKLQDIEQGIESFDKDINDVDLMIFYERMTIYPSSVMMESIRDAYYDRGLLDATSRGNGLSGPIVKVRLEETIMVTDHVSDGYNEIAIDVLNNMSKMGYHIIVFSDFADEYYDDAIKYLDNIGLNYDAYNFNLAAKIQEMGYKPKNIAADYVIDNRALPTRMLSEETWKNYFHVITGISYTMGFEDAVHGNSIGDRNLINQLEENKTKELQENEDDYDLMQCFRMTEDVFNELVSLGTFKLAYPTMQSSSYDEMRMQAFLELIKDRPFAGLTDEMQQYAKDNDLMDLFEDEQGNLK